MVGGIVGALLLASGSIASAQTVNILSANEASCDLYGVHIAKALGIYEDAGVDANMLSSETTVPYVAFLSNGDADLTMLDSAQVLQMANANQPGAVIYEVMQFAPEGIFVLSDGPIETLEDLRGKTIGLASDRDQITVIIALDSVGISIGEVSTVVVGDSGPLMANSLTSGQVAAFAGAASDRAGIEAAGVATHNITPTAVSQNVGNSYAIWIPRMEKIRYPASVFLRGLAMGNHAGVLDRNTTGAICRQAIPEQWEDLDVGWGLIDYSANVLNLKRTKRFGEPQPDVWAAVQKPYIALGEIDGFIEPATFLDFSFIDDANAWTTLELKHRLAAWREANPDALMD
jgi:NitT/TauT family transport system substrate-binding protein